jgi:CRISPR-associated protein Csx14
MGSASIPVDLVNPGQVFACLGLLEAADSLCGPAEGGFEWEDAPSFQLVAEGADDPIAHVLEFLTGAEVAAVAPKQWTAPKRDKKEGKAGRADQVERVEDAPAPDLSEMALPIILGVGNRPVVRLGHWADGSSRDSFKLYSGNRSACDIATAMLSGKKKGKRQDSLGIRQLWDERREQLVGDPFNTLCPMGGSFNFDARRAWTPLDAGYSPDEQDQKVFGSPVVELLAAWGLEHARPAQIEERVYRYAVWRERLSPMLARPALAGGIGNFRCRYFRMGLGLSGKNKVVRFAEEIGR